MKKRYATGALATILVMTGSLVPQIASAQVSPFAGGDGTAANPYQIGTATQMDTLMKDSQYWSDDFVLTADISMASVSSQSAWESPIGMQSIPFTGIFNGQGHTISELYIDNSADDTTLGAGLFGWTNGATIEHVSVEGIIVSGGTDVGALVGMAGAGTDITDCHAIGAGAIGLLVNGLHNVGGLVGENAGTITNSSVSQNGQLAGMLGIPFFNNLPYDVSTFGGIAGLNDATGRIAGSDTSDALRGIGEAVYPLPLIGTDHASALSGQLPEVPVAGVLPVLGLFGIGGIVLRRKRKHTEE